MTTIRKQIMTDLPVEQAFNYVADFASSAEWDPGVESARRIGDETGPIEVGTRYELPGPHGRPDGADGVRDHDPGGAASRRPHR